MNYRTNVSLRIFFDKLFTNDIQKILNKILYWQLEEVL